MIFFNEKIGLMLYSYSSVLYNLHINLKCICYKTNCSKMIEIQVGRRYEPLHSLDNQEI